jgi:hypothetical protein
MHVNSIVNNIVGASSIPLLEMAMSTRSLEAWKDGILNRITTRKGAAVGVRTQRHANYGDQYHHNIYYIGIFADSIKAALLPGCVKMYKEGIIKDKVSYLQNIHTLVTQSALDNSVLKTKIMQSIAIGLENTIPTPLTVKRDWFVPLVIELLIDALFKLIFKQNIDNKKVVDFYNKSTEGHEFYSDVEKEDKLIEIIELALDDADHSGLGILKYTADVLSIPYVRNINQLKLTANLIAQSREGYVADFKTTHPTER